MADHTKVGELREGNEPRDAIHIAVAPVIATETMNPGTYIGFCGEGLEEVSPCEPAMSVGIADPFLQKTIRPGDRIWMFLHPNTITSLKHNWTHPAFGSDDGLSSKTDSESWLRKFIAHADLPYSYDEVLEAVNTGSSKSVDDYYNLRYDGDYFYSNGRDASGEIPSEFWDHMEVVTGKKLTERPQHFSCAC
jgi:hypothetical protein